jgi:hypothetical protein
LHKKKAEQKKQGRFRMKPVRNRTYDPLQKWEKETAQIQENRQIDPGNSCTMRFSRAWGCPVISSLISMVWVSWEMAVSKPRWPHHRPQELSTWNLEFEVWLKTIQNPGSLLFAPKFAGYSWRFGCSLIPNMKNQRIS